MYKRQIPLTPNKVQRLNDFLYFSNCYDAIFQGRLFTWKKLIRGDLVYEKLDRVIFREDCLSLFPEYLVTNGPFTYSDHAYVFYNTNLAHPPQRGTLFKYQHSRPQYKDVHIAVKRNWKHITNGTTMCRVARTDEAQLNLKVWSRSMFGNFKNKLEGNAQQLLRVEGKLISQPNNARLNNWHYRLIKQRKKMYLFNQKYWGKLARKDWLVHRDRNSRYFHQSMKSRKSCHRIIKIKDSSGIWIDDSVQIQSCFVDDFIARFKSAHSDTMSVAIDLHRSVSNEDNDQLL